MQTTISVINPKVTLFYDQNKPYMTLTAESELSDKTIVNITIPKIDLSKIQTETRRTNRGNVCRVFFDTLPIVEIESEFKEMTLKEIEKELGHKIIIKEEI
jgi:hypothetical protein